MDAHGLPDHSPQLSAPSNPQSSSEPEHLALANALRNAASNAQTQSGQPLQWLQPFSVAPLSVAQTDARFNEAHPPGPRGIKRRGGGRPRKPDSELKRPRADPRARPTKLRPNATVELHVPSDVWFHIFLFADYKTVRSLRQTCRDTYEATDSVIFWKEYIRRHAHPPHTQLSLQLPDPPPGLTLSQYADLLFGQGCMRCNAAKSKKVQWAFYRRWCKTCFSDMTYSDSEAKGITAKYGDILGCIPTGIIDIWKNYHCVSNLTANRISANYRSMKKYVAVTKKDLTVIVNECEAFLGTLPAELTEVEREEQLKTWRQERTVENSKYLEHAKACEDFANLREEWLSVQNAREVLNFRQQRELFFREKAAQLQPPMNPRVLHKIPGFQKSIAVKRPPTERSWREILHNIEVYRDRAEKASAQEDPLSMGNPGQSIDSRLGYHQAQARKHSVNQSEGPATSMLEDFANIAMKDLENAQTSADDFTYLTLQRVREMYYSLSPQHQPRCGENDQVKPEDGSDRYVLTMQDALNIQTRKIEPRLRAWRVEGKIKRWPRFYCPGCTRRDYRKEWEFDKLFLHLFDAHARKDLSSPWRSYAETTWANQLRTMFTSMFHWQGIPWPHNLPILAAHHKPTGRWDPDDDTYECAPPLEENASVSPFEGRSVRKCSSKDNSVVQVATDAILEASKILSNVKAPAQLKGMIAWRFATDNTEKLAYEKLSPHHLDDLSTALVRHGEFATFSKVGCKFCDMQCDPHADKYMSVRSHLKYTEMKHSFDTIARHWKQDHVGSNDRFNVATEMLLFPTESELVYELFESSEEGNTALREAFDYLFPSIDASSPGSGTEAETSNGVASGSSSRRGGNSRAQSKKRWLRSGLGGARGGKGSNAGSTSLDQTALNLLAEQAVKIDPRLAVDESGNNDGEVDDTNSTGGSSESDSDESR